MSYMKQIGMCEDLTVRLRNEEKSTNINYISATISDELYFKGTVQRELTWVKSGINRQLMVCQSVA
jgi:hypothetical protein